MNPITIFNEWLQQEKNVSAAAFPDTCCFTTIGLDGFPNSRFVSLKAVKGSAFIVTGSLASRKGLEVKADAKVALTFWWPVTEKQVRIQGIAFPITPEEADIYFAERDIAAKIAATVCRQGQELEAPELLKNDFLQKVAGNANRPVPRPGDWGGYSIEPLRIELMEFRRDRFHHRTLFERHDTVWRHKNLQP